MNKPTVITLCGSTRFMDDYIKANRDLTLQGYIVISVGMFGHQEGLDMAGETKKMLDELHLRKIDLSNEILVINPITKLCGYCHKPCTEIEVVMDNQRPDAALVEQTSCCKYRHIYQGTYIGDSTKREIAYAKQTGKIVRYLNLQVEE